MNILYRPALFTIASASIFSATTRNTFKCDQAILPVQPPIQKPNSKYTLPVQLMDAQFIANGIRQVTFLLIDAYQLGLYIPQKTKQNLKASSRWREEYVADRWMSHNPFYLSDLLLNDLTLCVSPVKDTDGSHIRGGFLRLIAKEMKLKKLEKTKEFSDNIEAFSKMFPSTPIPKDSIVIFQKTGDVMNCFIGERKLGVVSDPLIINNLIGGYLNGSYISPSFFNSVANGLETLFK